MTAEQQQAFSRFEKLQHQVSVALSDLSDHMNSKEFITLVNSRDPAVLELLETEDVPEEFGMYVSGLYDSHCD